MMLKITLLLLVLLFAVFSFSIIFWLSFKEENNDNRENKEKGYSKETKDL